MNGWMTAILIALGLYVLKAGNSALKTMITGQAPTSGNPAWNTRLCGLADLLAVPGTLMEAFARPICSGIAGAMKYVWQQFVKSVKALFAAPA